MTAPPSTTASPDGYTRGNCWITYISWLLGTVKDKLLVCHLGMLLLMVGLSLLVELYSWLLWKFPWLLV
jgi:hypothetical protein